MKKFKMLCVFFTFVLLITSIFADIKIDGSAVDVSGDIEEINLYNQNTECDLKSISEKLIRFHVVANSDEYSDQKVKLEIRDVILKKIGQGLSSCRTRQESLSYLNEKLSYIDNIANEMLAKNGKKYTAKSYLGNFNFPIKQYGDITLPEGRYTALKVMLGEGGGKNWWCVMFPPLCFIDITRGITTEETNKSLGKVLSSDEVKSITGNNAKLQKNSKIQIKFKSLEIIKKLLGK